METHFPPSYPRRHHHHHHHHRRLLSHYSMAAYPPCLISFASVPYHHHTHSTNNPNYTSIIHLRRSIGALTSSSGRCRATSPGSPPPPKLDSSDDEKQSPLSVASAMSTLSKVQDGVRIFLAVLFWMSLFFWSCASDRGNNGRSNKDSRFRR